MRHRACLSEANEACQPACRNARPYPIRLVETSWLLAQGTLLHSPERAALRPPERNVHVMSKRVLHIRHNATEQGEYQTLKNREGCHGRHDTFPSETR